MVEDEPTVAQLIVDVLREEGHHAEAVLDSQDGLTRISRHPYDLVICDLRMPRLDGPAFYDALVRSGSPIRDKILFTTGDTLAPRTIEFLEPNGLPVSRQAVPRRGIEAGRKPFARCRTEAAAPDQVARRGKGPDRESEDLTAMEVAR